MQDDTFSGNLSMWFQITQDTDYISLRAKDLNVAEVRLPGVAMLLGADFLGSREVWISYGTGRLFLR